MDGGQVVSVHMTDPALSPADPIPDRGRVRYKEYWEGEITCPIVRESVHDWPRWDAFNPYPRRVYVEYLYNNKTILLVLNRCRRAKRWRNVYGPQIRNAKQRIWRRKREEDRRQKEHRLKEDTWFLYHGDRADEDENVVVFRQSKRSAGSLKKAVSIKARDEWRTNLKRPKEYLPPKDLPAVEVQPSLRDPNKDWWTNHEPVNMFEGLEPVKSKLRRSDPPLLPSLLSIAL